MRYTQTMKDDPKPEPKQKTPKGYEIPIPKKADWDRMLKRVATPLRRRRPK